MLDRTGRSKLLLPTLGLAAVLLTASTPQGCRSEPLASPQPGDITDPTLQVARSPHGMVASASRFATKVGAQVLAAGGNAVDAATATAFVLAVTEPSMSGLGGRAKMLVRLPDGEIVGIDGLNQVPWGYESGAPPGYARAAIPGVPAALVTAMEDMGSWPLSRVVEPAIRLAEEGFRLPADEAARIANVAETLREHEGSARYFLKADGTPYQTGELFVQTDLARTLRAIAEHGAAGFYGGWVADSIHADMVRNGGFITREELEQYEAMPAIIVRGDYRGYPLYGTFRPASGHSVILALQIMEHFDLPRMAGTPAWASITGQAMQFGISERGRNLGTAEETARTMTSKSYAAERAARIRVPGHTGDTGLPASIMEQELHTANREASVTGTAVGVTETTEIPDRESTTHLSAADSDGMVVSLTLSIGPSMGTRLAAPGVGFLYATRLGSTPGSRPSSTIAPTIVLHPDGQPAFALGGAGDSRIISAVIQTISRLIDQEMPLYDAIRAPRVHPVSSTALRVEQGVPASWSNPELEQMEGFGLETSVSPSTYFGRVHAVAFDPSTGQFSGAADARRSGSAAGPRP